MLAWQGATRTKARRGAGPRGGALSLAARWATTKRKLDATDDASEPSPRKRVAVTLEPPSTSLDILDLAVLRRLSDEHGPTHPDHDASSPGGDETTPFEVEPMEADVDHDELLHRPSNKRVRDPADDFLRDPLDADHPSFVFPARGVTAPRSPAPASGAPTAGTPRPPSREEPPAPPPNSQDLSDLDIDLGPTPGSAADDDIATAANIAAASLDDAARELQLEFERAFPFDGPAASLPDDEVGGELDVGQIMDLRHGALPAPHADVRRRGFIEGCWFDGGSLTLHDITGGAGAGAVAGASVDRDVLLELLSRDEFRAASEAGGFLRIEDEIFALGRDEPSAGRRSRGTARRRPRAPRAREGRERA